MRQPHASELMRAKVDGCSSDALVEMLALAGIELEVTPRATRRILPCIVRKAIRPPPPPVGASCS